MSQHENPSRYISLNKLDITGDARNTQKELVNQMDMKRKALQDVHLKERQTLLQNHGQNLRAIFRECADEPPALMERRVQSCRKSYERERDALGTVQERMEIYQDVGLKREWEKRFPNAPFPSRNLDKVMKERQERYHVRDQDSKVDKNHFTQELEHDRLIKSYMDGQASYEQFQQEFTAMSRRHMSESIPIHEKQFSQNNTKSQGYIMDK